MAAQSLALQVGVAPACRALGVPRATFYRRHRSTPGRQQPRPPGLCTRTNENAFWRRCPHRASSTAPRPRSSRRFSTKGSTFARNARCIGFWLQASRVRERRNQLTHPSYTKPELVATAPNETWSWDITRLLGPKRWTYFYLYVLLDIFSRYVVGWMVAERESSALAARLIEQTCLKQGIEPQTLTLHSDRGGTDDEQVHRAVAGRPRGDPLAQPSAGQWTTTPSARRSSRP